jgi:hypothetical protein
MCLFSHLAGIILLRHSPMGSAVAGLFGGCAFLVLQFSSFYFFSIALWEARRVLTAEVYNGSFAFVFRMQFDGESLMENSRSIKMQGEIR